MPRSSAEPKAAATPGYGYTSSMESVRTPMGGESWNSSFPHNPFTSDLQPSQRVVHTQVFKLIEVGEGPNRRTQLWITETDSHETERLRRPEFFFHGIVGHVKDSWDYPSMDGVKPPILPITGVATSISKKCHSLLIRLSRMGSRRTMTSLKIQREMHQMEVPTETADHVPSVPRQTHPV